MSRRAFLGRTALTGAGLAAPTTLAGLFATAGPAGAFPAGGYGDLVVDPQGIVDLPSGFTYKVLSSRNAYGTVLQPATFLGLRGQVPADNQGVVPGDPDGMASFYDASTGRTYLVCNHELNGSGEVSKRVPTTYKGNPVPFYDSNVNACGGTTTIVLDSNMDVIEHYPSLTGTANNCAGGPTPWNTWLTCEEAQSVYSGKQHGYLVEVDPKGVLTNGVAYKAMGRANHEAVAIDPSNSDAYITEDGGLNSLLYKFVPTDKSQTFGSLGNGGQLFAMKVPGFDNFAQITSVGTAISGVTWVAGPANPDVANLQGQWPASGSVTRGNKLEGCWWADGKLWFVCSFSGLTGFANDGQVFVYDPAATTITQIMRIPTGGVSLLAGSGSHLVLDPDNITVTPYGGAMWCQDGGGSQYVVGLAPDGAAFPFARNPGSGEWAGANFSANGQWLFAAMQTRHLVVAITGPWGETTEVPEVPASILLPLTGLAAAGAAVVALRSRTTSNSPA